MGCCTFPQTHAKPCSGRSECTADIYPFHIRLPLNVFRSLPIGGPPGIQLRMQVLDLAAVDPELGGFYGGFASGGIGYLVPSRSFEVGFSPAEDSRSDQRFAPCNVLP